ncbi:MAG: RecX family transcriptional regulator [Eubacteriales bacterium]
MEITDIMLQKNEKFFNLYVEGKYLCSLDQELIYMHQLFVGKQIDEEEISRICTLSLTKKAFNQSLRYLSYQMRTEKEIIVYLTEKHYPAQVVNAVINKLKNYRYIDDENYMKMYIKSRMLSGYTQKKILYKLMEKGLDELAIRQVIQDIYPDTTEQEALKKEASKLNDKYEDLPYQEKLIKTTQSCLRKGFCTEDITKILPQILKENETEKFMLRFKKLADHYLSKHQKKGIDKKVVRQKTMQALYRKGYGMDLIRKYFMNSDA